jgi:CHASE3 domain sensor protein
MARKPLIFTPGRRLALTLAVPAAAYYAHRYNMNKIARQVEVTKMLGHRDFASAQSSMRALERGERGGSYYLTQTGKRKYVKSY